MSRESKKAWFDRHRQVNTWMDLKDYERLRAIAERNGQTVSEAVRNVLLRVIQTEAK